MLRDAKYSTTEMSTQDPSFVTPAKAGVQRFLDHAWIPAFAGMTSNMGSISDTLFYVVVLSISLSSKRPFA